MTPTGVPVMRWPSGTSGDLTGSDRSSTAVQSLSSPEMEVEVQEIIEAESPGRPSSRPSLTSIGALPPSLSSSPTRGRLWRPSASPVARLAKEREISATASMSLIGAGGPLGSRSVLTWSMVTSDFLHRRAFSNLGAAERLSVINLEVAIELKRQRLGLVRDLDGGQREEESEGAATVVAMAGDISSLSAKEGGGTGMGMSGGSDQGHTWGKGENPPRQNHRPFSGPVSEDDGGIGRRLREGGNGVDGGIGINGGGDGDGRTLHLLFNVVVSLLMDDPARADPGPVDLGTYVSLAFDDLRDQTEYMSDLRSTDDPIFDDIIFISVDVVTVDDLDDGEGWGDDGIIRQGRGEGEGGNISNKGAVALVVALAGLCVLFVAAGIFMPSYWGKRDVPLEEAGVVDLQSLVGVISLASIDDGNGDSLSLIDLCVNGSATTISSLGEVSYSSRIANEEPYCTF